MRIISFNANGIRSAAKKGFYTWLHQQQADFVCIQETKAQRHQLTDPMYSPLPFYCEYYDAVKKGYSGVALYAREKPQNVIGGLGFDACDLEGRYLQFDYPNISVISLYLPSGTSGDARQAVKYDFLNRFADHLRCLRQLGREVVICGDFNIAHKRIDLKNWRGNQTHSGFLPEERAFLDEVYGEMGYVDAFRAKNQSEHEYTWWSNRGQARANNVGWRIDYQAVTPLLSESIQAVSIYRDVMFSDHAPLMIDYDWRLTTHV